MWFEAWAKKKDGKEDRPKERRNNQKAFYACTFCMYLIAANHPGCIAWPGQARHGLTLTEPQNIKALCVISYGNRESLKPWTICYGKLFVQIQMIACHKTIAGLSVHPPYNCRCRCRRRRRHSHCAVNAEFLHPKLYYHLLHLYLASWRSGRPKLNCLLKF